MISRPSLEDVPCHTGWGLSDQEWRAMQEKRRAFKGLPCSRTPYTRYNGELEEQERACFCAAGFFLWRLGEHEAEVLMVWEDREGRRLLNFPGGNRDTVEEQPLEVAVRETNEETAFLLSEETLNAMRSAASMPVIWIPTSKYVLHVLELGRHPANVNGNIVDQFANLERGTAGGPLPLLQRGGDPGVMGLAWVRASDLLANRPDNFHPFTQTMIRNLKDARILPRFS